MTATGPRLWGRTPLIGTVLTLPGAVSAELFSEPLDVVWVDLEHGALGRTEAQEMILGAQAASTLALVRVGIADAAGLVGPMLDAGADGIVAADVRNPEQAQWLASLTQHPPDGRRGYGPRRSMLRGRTHGERRDRTGLWMQIESQEGVAAVEAIAHTRGLDALVVGIADLCIDLGIPIGLSDPRLHDALHSISAAADHAGVRFGLAGPLHPVAQLGGLLDAVSVLVHSTDARLCAATVDSLATTLREHLRGAVPLSAHVRGGGRG
jgi:4-hydroxy-2-oxoheptanedioate aldolase